MKQQAIKSLLRSLKQLDQERRRRTADLEEAAKVIGRQLLDLGHGSNGRAMRTKKTASKPVAPKSRKRIRRSPEQLKDEAKMMIQFIRSKGSGGASAKEIKAHGVMPGQDVKGFAKQYAGVTLKSTGKKSQTRYHVA